MRLSVKVVLGVLAMIVVAVGVYFLARPENCDGLPRSIGACAGDRPTISGLFCEEVAAEWGQQLDDEVVEIIDGPGSARGQARSSRLYDAETLVSQLANQHLRENGLTTSCIAEGFLTVGESQFSERTTREVGLGHVRRVSTGRLQRVARTSPGMGGTHTRRA